MLLKNVIEVSKTLAKTMQNANCKKMQFFLLWYILEMVKEQYSYNNHMILNISMNFQLLLICEKWLKNNLQK